MQSELTVDSLAQEIRRVDGSNSLGAGALAEALMPFLTAALSDKQGGEVSCIACEGRPSAGNNPCAVCGRSALVDVQAVEPVAPSAIDDLTLPVVGTLYVSRGCATARAVRGIENGPDEYSNLVRISDVAAALEPFRSRLSREGEDSAEVAPHTNTESALRILHEGINEAEADIDFDADAGNRSDLSQYGVSLPYETAREIASLLRYQGTREHKRGIYIASKTKHAERWRFLRDKVGEPIISTWIDEAGVGETSDFSDLWRRCILEASTAEVLIVYREAEDVLKGGWVEVGAALASGVPVFAVGIEDFTVAHDKRIRHFPDMKAAIAAARTALAATRSDSATTAKGGSDA